MIERVETRPAPRVPPVTRRLEAILPPGNNEEQEPIGNVYTRRQRPWLLRDQVRIWLLFIGAALGFLFWLTVDLPWTTAVVPGVGDKTLFSLRWLFVDVVFGVLVMLVVLYVLMRVIDYFRSRRRANAAKTET